MEFVGYVLFCAFSIAAYCEADKASTTGLQAKSVDELKKPMVIFLDKKDTPVGAGIYLSVNSKFKVLAHADQLPNRDGFRCKIEIGNKDYFGFAKPFMAYENLYYLLSATMLLPDMPDEQRTSASIFDTTYIHRSAVPKFYSVGLREEKLHIVPHPCDVVIAQEYITSSECEGKIPGDFIFANNDVLGIFDRCIEGSPNVALYHSIKFMTYKFLSNSNQEDTEKIGRTVASILRLE